MLEQSSSSLSVTLDEGRVLHQTRNKNILCVEAKLTSQMSQKQRHYEPYEGPPQQDAPRHPPGASPPAR